jgi:outer membrane protein OmpA-like peptidoglycan-associated protein
MPDATLRRAILDRGANADVRARHRSAPYFHFARIFRNYPRPDRDGHGPGAGPIHAPTQDDARHSSVGAYTAPAPPPTVQEPASPAEEPPGSATTPGFPQNLEEFSDEPALKDVLFEPGRADIVRDGASIMMSNARWLVARWLVDNRDYFVLIEGHIDAREARGNNQLIAELRAKAAARFLVAMGVPEARLNTVSYGSA